MARVANKINQTVRDFLGFRLSFKTPKSILITYINSKSKRRWWDFIQGLTKIVVEAAKNGVGKTRNRGPFSSSCRRWRAWVCWKRWGIGRGGQPGSFGSSLVAWAGRSKANTGQTWLALREARERWGQREGEWHARKGERDPIEYLVFFNKF